MTDELQAMQDKIDRLHRNVTELVRERDKLRELVRDIEWGTENLCNMCGGVYDDHEDDCKVKQALADNYSCSRETIIANREPDVSDNITSSAGNVQVSLSDEGAPNCHTPTDSIEK